jgi:Tfp pilus assembly protein PilN
MAGINLIEQLRQRESTQAQDAAMMESGPSLFERLGIGGGSGGSSGEGLGLMAKVQGLLMLVGIAAIPMGRDWLQTTYLPPKLEAPQAELDKVRADIKAKEAQKARIAAIEVELNQFDQQVADIKAKIEKIRMIREGNRDRIVRMVDYIVTQMPEPVWISTLDLAATPGASVALAGRSMNYQNISTFVGRLQTGAFFPTWELEESSREMMQRSGGASHAAMSFRLKAQVVDIQ